MSILPDLSLCSDLFCFCRVLANWLMLFISATFSLICILAGRVEMDCPQVDRLCCKFDVTKLVNMRDNVEDEVEFSTKLSIPRVVLQGGYIIFAAPMLSS